MFRFVILALLVGAQPGGTLLYAGLVFNFLPDPGTPQYVVEGFMQAANRWSAVLTDDITVNLSIGFLPLPAGVLGDTSAPYFEASYASVGAALHASSTSADDFSAYANLQPGPSYTRLINHTADHPNGANSALTYADSLSPVFLTRANAKALQLLGPDLATDGGIRFNSNLGFDFNPADGTTPGQFDFATVAAHEIGHILGFVSIVDDLEASNGTGLAAQLPATVLDLFRFSIASLALGPGVVDVAADGRDKYFSVDGGASAVAQFATGAVYSSGYQARHWKEFTFSGLMDPMSFTGLQRQIGNRDLRALDVIGYTRAGVPEPGSAVLLMLGGLLWRYGFRRGRG